MYFADVAVHALVSGPGELDALETRLARPHFPDKCAYLGPRGCLMGLPPIVCAMFLCEASQKEVFTQDPDARRPWRDLEDRRKRFTWPDRPVLFESLEAQWMAAGFQSDLMHIHNSPGLARMVRNRQS